MMKPGASQRRVLAAAVLPAVTILFFYQNCGEMALQLEKQGAAAALTTSRKVSGRFCGHRQPSSQVSTYELGYFFAVNLTALRQRGEWVADSNVNGVNDLEEGGAEISTVNIIDDDSDGDGIPDFLEILKGTNPGYADATIDGIDEDGITNVVEIQTGRDPSRPDADQPPALVSQFSRSALGADGQCGRGQYAYDFELDRLVLAATTEFTETGNLGYANLSHTAGENLILIGARMNPTNSSMGSPVFWGRIVRIQKDSPSDINVAPLDFDRF